MPSQTLQIDSSWLLLLLCLGSSPDYTHQATWECPVFCHQIVTNDWTTDTESLKSRLHWPSLRNRWLTQKLCLRPWPFSHSSHLLFCALNISSYPQKLTPLHTVPSPRPSIIGTPSGTQLLNSIPDSIASLSSDLFKPRLRSHLNSLYAGYWCNSHQVTDVLTSFLSFSI